MHTRPFGQDTPPSPTLSAPAGCGEACCPQALTRPNQRSTRGERHAGPSLDSPTAVHVRLSGHETLVRALRSDPVGFGVDCTCQPVPSQRSASVRVFGPVCRAHGTNRGAGEETGAVDVSSVPRRDGRARLNRPARPVPELDHGDRAPRLPTAKQTFDRGHEMPCSDPDGLGVGTICQLVPSQRSTTGTAAPGPAEPSFSSPTAMHEFADEQSTPSRIFVGFARHVRRRRNGPSGRCDRGREQQRDGRNQGKDEWTRWQMPQCHRPRPYSRLERSDRLLELVVPPEELGRRRRSWGCPRPPARSPRRSPRAACPSPTASRSPSAPRSDGARRPRRRPGRCPRRSCPGPPAKTWRKQAREKETTRPGLLRVDRRPDRVEAVVLDRPALRVDGPRAGRARRPAAGSRRSRRCGPPRTTRAAGRSSSARGRRRSAATRAARPRPRRTAR